MSVPVGLAFTAALSSAGSVSFTCDSTVASMDGSGVCNYLNSTVAGIYGNTFTNASASIYVTTSGTGLGQSYDLRNQVSYSTFYNALAAESTNAVAVASLPSTEPAIFSGASVWLTASQIDALGISVPASYGYDPDLNPCVLGSDSCYNGVIAIVTPAGLSSESGGTQGLWFRNVDGTAAGSQPANDIDYFSAVEHEVDEILGTASCSSVTAGPTASYSSGCAGVGPVASAIDLFRYSAPGALVYNSLTPATQYFSPDGGVTDTAGATYNTSKVGEDFGDFSQACAFVQDAEGCLGLSFDITNDFQGGAGPEVAMLNAVGFNLNSTSTATPEPGSVVLLCGSLGVLALYRRRKA